jgi:hypothetical protein
MSPSFLDRVLGRVSPPAEAERPPSPGPSKSVAPAESPRTRGKYLDITDPSARLEAVGESHYQEALHNAVGGWPREYVTYEVVATLMAEPNNLYDENAIAVGVGARVVGYLSRRDAVAYRRLFQKLGSTGYAGASCQAVICGGGSDRPNLGIFLRAADPRSAEHRAEGSDTPLPPVAQLVRPAEERPKAAGPASERHGESQTLWCERGQHHWERAATRGRPPRNCPDHR